jgi:hypothetical protein
LNRENLENFPENKAEESLRGEKTEINTSVPQQMEATDLSLSYINYINCWVVCLYNELP